MARHPPARADRPRPRPPPRPLVDAATAPLRVLLVNDLALDAGGGVETHVAVVADALTAAGHVVEVFAGQVLHHRAGRVLDLWDPRARRLLARRAGSFAPDVVHLHNVLRELSPSVVGVPAHTPCVLSVHDSRLADGGHGLARRAATAVARTVVRRRVDLLVAHSQAMAQRLAGHRLPEVRLLPPLAAAPRSIRGPAPSASADLLYAGRLSPEKGVDILIDAFLALAADHPAARLLVAGDGPEGDRLRARAARAGGRVEFLGRLDRRGIERQLGQVRAVVVPSLGAEGGPVVTVEAALAGRPVVVSGVPGAAEVVEVSGGGLVVSPGDVQALAHALHCVLGDDDLADRLGDAGRRHASSHNTADVVARALTGVYRDAISRRAPSGGGDGG